MSRHGPDAPCFGRAAFGGSESRVQIPADYAQVVDLTKKYFVFVTPNDARIKQLAVTSCQPDRFAVEDRVGNADGAFSFVVVGHRLPAIR